MSSFIIDKCLGAVETVHPSSIPDGYVIEAHNVDLSATEALRPRAGTSEVSMTSGPADEVVYLFADNANGRLWAFVAATGTAYYWNGSSWSSTSLGADYTSSDTPHCVAYNGKVFMAFNGSVNRLHVYDGTSVRRVGLVAPAAPSVANQGAGAYAATLRYYKVQFVRYNASSGVTSATSELSAATSFTPSGAGASARVTMPTNADSATHWRVYGSTDNSNFYDLAGLIAVATTTYDDSTTPSAYSGGTIAPEAGLYVPPPSAKFLATNGERIFMAGSYETSASSGETTPAERRVWFTRPLGVTDRGDDEAITQTADSRYYLDIDNDDGGPITGLASTLEGSVYAFTATSVWRLVDTGNADKPLRSERVIAGAGALSQYLITTSDTQNASAVYFMAKDGPYRYSPNEGAVWLGADWVDMDKATSSPSNPQYFSCAQFDPVYRRVVFGSANRTYARVFSPGFGGASGVVRGGWAVHQFGFGTPSSVKTMAVFNGRLYYGGKYFDIVSKPLVSYHDETKTTDGSSSFSVYTKTGDLIADPVRNATFTEPYIVKTSAIAGTVQYTSGLTTQSASDTFVAADVGRVKVEGLYLSDMPSVVVTTTVTTLVARSTAGYRSDAIARIVVPYKVQEAA